MILSDLYLWLAYSHLPTQKINRILDKIPLARLWESFDDEGKYKLDEKTFNALKRTRSLDYIEQAKQYLEINNIKYVTRADPIYPEALDQKEVDPPPVIFYKGDINVLRKPCLAVVGTRRASQYGRYAVEKIVDELASSFTIVSGLATGIDGYSHDAALRAGGYTAAVLGSGLFNPSPVSNLRLFDEICNKGVVLSEYTPDTHATNYTFPARNRIISGLSKGVLVVEAAEKSGSLITASCALDQGRDVFAVPGDIDKPRSAGTNRLIKNGAIAVTCAQDILDQYSIVAEQKKNAEQYFPIDFSQQQVLDILEMGEKSFDMLVESCGMTIPELNAALSSLMIFGLVHEKSKNLYCISK
ncbi:MAG: DNA-protecting protein DprA [Clostridiales bacterium]|nr:DNA-protecting protein DprA [Clostridiales bacterium]